MRAACYATLLAVLCLVLVGCWDMQEPDDLRMVVAIGIDAGNRPDTIKVTVHTSPPVGGGTGGNEGSPSLRVVTVEAVSLFEALTLLNTHIRNDIFIAHVLFIVFGEDLARGGIGDALGGVIGVEQVRPSVPIFVAAGSAESVLRARSAVGNVPGQDVIDLLTNIREAPVGIRVSLKSAINTLTSLGSELAIPILQTVPLRLEPGDFSEEGAGQGDDQEEVIMARLALFNRDRWVADLDPYETQVLVLLRGETRQGSITFINPADPDGMMAAQMDFFLRHMISRQMDRMLV